MKIQETVVAFHDALETASGLSVEIRPSNENYAIGNDVSLPIIVARGPTIMPDYIDWEIEEELSGTYTPPPDNVPQWDKRKWRTVTNLGFKLQLFADRLSTNTAGTRLGAMDLIETLMGNVTGITALTVTHGGTDVDYNVETDGEWTDNGTPNRSDLLLYECEMVIEGLEIRKDEADKRVSELIETIIVLEKGVS